MAFTQINPVGINEADVPNEEEERFLSTFNKLHAPRSHGMIYTEKADEDKRTELLEKRYTLPVEQGQLYTARDLTFGTWEERGKIRRAVQEATQDPFKKLNVNPIHEYKVLWPG